MEALAVRTTGSALRGATRSPGRGNLAPAIWARPEVIGVPDVSMTRIDRRPRATGALLPDVNPHDPLRTLAIAAYRRGMTEPDRAVQGAPLIDTYL